VTMTIGVYELMLWHADKNILSLVKSSLWIMLATLVRYDGWFLLIYASAVVVLYTWRHRGYKTAEGTFILFATLAAFGIVLWFLWNLVIFKDPFYFALGPFSAHAQQMQMKAAGVLATQGNMLLSIQVYLYSLIFNSTAIVAIFGTLGALALVVDRKINIDVRIATTTLLAPLFFNILALFFGFSVLFVQGISGDTWFNVRYGILMLPSLAIFTGYLVHRFKPLRFIIICLLLFVTAFALANGDAVTIDDARVGSSQKNVSEVSGYLNTHAKNEKGFILISAASHDAIIFSSGLPMKRFIHEGTGAYWLSATTSPDRWARWIVMRTYDNNDLTWKAVSKVRGFAEKYILVAKYPFADVYQLKPIFLPNLVTEPVLGKQR
jgi:hypothetical protein